MEWKDLRIANKVISLNVIMEQCFQKSRFIKLIQKTIQKTKTLSIGGRLTLIKSVLTSLPLYHMSLYKAPLGVLRDLESLRRKFFNGADINEKRLSMISWNKILASKQKGGL
ncbi:hypothetical protein Tco_0283781, partial [Tanacetum coccineum]